MLSDPIPQQASDPDTPSLHQAAPFALLRTAFLRSLQAQDYAPATIASYAHDLNTFGAWLQQHNLTVLKLSASHLQHYKSCLRTTRQRRAATINRSVATLRQFYRWAHYTRLLPTPPRMPRRLPMATGSIRWLNATEQRRLLRPRQQQHHTRDMAAIVLLLHTGLRAAELCTLQWQDIHMTPHSGCVRVQQAKGQRERTVPLNAAARDALQQLGYNRHANTQRPILQGQRRRPLTTRSLQRSVGRHGKQVGIAQLSPHSLRHTFCKNLIDSGVGLETVARLAGHAHIQTTRRYCEPSWQDLERAVATLGNSSVWA